MSKTSPSQNRLQFSASLSASNTLKMDNPGAQSFPDDIWVRCEKLLNAIAGPNCSEEEKRHCVGIARIVTDHMFSQDQSPGFVKKRYEFLTNQIEIAVLYLMETDPNITVACQILRKTFLDIIYYYTDKYFTHMFLSLELVMPVLQKIIEEENEAMILLSLRIITCILYSANPDVITKFESSLTRFVQDMIELVKGVATTLFCNQHASFKVLITALQLMEVISANDLFPLEKLINEDVLYTLNFSSKCMEHNPYFTAMMKFLVAIHKKLPNELVITLMGLLSSKIYDSNLSIQMQTLVCKFCITCMKLLISRISSSEITEIKEKSVTFLYNLIQAFNCRLKYFTKVELHRLPLKKRMKKLKSGVPVNPYPINSRKSKTVMRGSYFSFHKKHVNNFIVY